MENTLEVILDKFTEEEIDHAPYLEDLLKSQDWETYKQFIDSVDIPVEYRGMVYECAIDNLIYSDANFKEFYLSNKSRLDDLFVTGEDY